jgi:hypothetical protein
LFDEVDWPRKPNAEQLGQHQPAAAGAGCTSANAAAAHAHAMEESTSRFMCSRMQRV